VESRERKGKGRREAKERGGEETKK